MNIDYIAGFFDGEGCITIGKKKAPPYENSTYGYYLVPSVVIVQKDTKILELIHDELNEYFIGSCIKHRADACSQLAINGAKRVLKFCDLVLDNIYVKKEQVRLVKKYIEKRLSLPQKTPYDAEDIALPSVLTALKKNVA